MRYSPTAPVPGKIRTQADLVNWILQELQTVSGAFREPEFEHVSLEVLGAEPERLYEGLTVMAEGTAWNPGAGKGVYTYHGGIWNKLG